MRKPLCIDGFCGLGGWAEGFLAEGWDVIGFDIEQHVYGEHRYPGMLVIQDMLTVHGSQFKGADCLVMSPPCQAYSYRAMPWSRAKALPPPDNALFDACFRIQREACEAAGRHIPMVIENVRGAQPWVGRARWNFGSYYLWGDVPALMPTARAFKSAGLNWSDRSKPCDYTRLAGRQAMEGIKTAGPGWDAEAGHARWGMPRWTNPSEGRKGAGAGAAWFYGNLCQLPSASLRRKEASAMIAKIPLPLSRHIARTFRP